MPSPRILPDNDVLVALKNQGWTYQQIADHFGVSRGAVYLRLKSVPGAVRKRARHKDLIPWTVALAHQQARPVRELRNLALLRRGGQLPPAKRSALDAWLADVKAKGVVVCYHPEFPPNPASPVSGGFHYSRRRPSDGDNLVRAECDHVPSNN